MVYDTFKKTFFSHLHQSFNIVEAMKESENPDGGLSYNHNNPLAIKLRL